MSKLIVTESLSLMKFQVPPVLTLINALTDKITKPEIESTFGRLMLNMERLPSLVDLGTSFIPNDFTFLGEFKVNYILYD